jgi:hypothetical protein
METTAMAHPAITMFRKAVKGLLYMSEKDAPFKVVPLNVDDSITPQNVAELVGQRAGTPVEEVSTAHFFGELTQVRKWHAEDDKAVVKRYQDLVALLRQQLHDLRIFKVGRVKVKIVIAGQTEDGQWIAIETDSLET